MKTLLILITIMFAGGCSFDEGGLDRPRAVSGKPTVVYLRGPLVPSAPVRMIMTNSYRSPVTESVRPTLSFRSPVTEYEKLKKKEE